MEKNLTIIDKDYLQWVKDLALRYRQSQIKAAVKVNAEAILFYWNLGRDIVDKQVDKKYGSAFFLTLSKDLRKEMPDVTGLSERNIRYAKNFYLFYNQININLQQAVAESSAIFQQLAGIFQIPWGHHCVIMDKVKGDRDRARDDNPTIGLLVCRDKDNTLAQYALEGTNQPLAISSYDLERLYPTKVEGLIPTIEEIEAQLNNQMKKEV